jgi:GMP synthase-like glutamine amidotransferase
MNTLIFQHATSELPGTLTEWLKLAGHQFEVQKVYKEGPLPDPARFDWLIVLGGPMNVDEEEKHPWLKTEKKFLADWVKADKPVLGICLGGQMLAQVLGGKVTKNRAREIGFHDVRRTGADHPAFKNWPEQIRVFQYHEDRFSLPEGCRSLLTNDICEHQAFSYDHKTVGLQFHPESTEPWIMDAVSDLVPQGEEPFVQSTDECTALLPVYLPPLTSQFFTFLDDFSAAAWK